MKTPLPPSVFAFFIDVFCVLCFLVVFYSCQEKPAVPAAPAASAAERIIHELSSVKTQQESEKAVMHLWQAVTQARWGNSHLEDQYRKYDIYRTTIRKTAQAHLNHVTAGQAAPGLTAGTIIRQMLAGSRVLRNTPTAPAITAGQVFAALERQVAEALRKPAAPENLLPMLLAGNGKTATVEEHTVLSPVQQFSLLLWWSQQENLSRPVRPNLPGARTAWEETCAERCRRHAEMDIYFMQLNMENDCWHLYREYPCPYVGDEEYYKEMCGLLESCLEGVRQTCENELERLVSDCVEHCGDDD
jgi:hypothetical protein